MRITAPRAAAPRDVLEQDAHSIVGITYPHGLQRYPGLARILIDHAAADRAELERLLADKQDPQTRYELTIHFAVYADAADLYAVKAIEEWYTGGTGSRPRQASFVWLPREQRLLAPDEVIGGAGARTAIHAYLESQNADDLPREMSGSHVAPEHAHDDVTTLAFVPRTNSQGKVAGFQFHLGSGDLEVPAAVLKPHVNPAYAAWFE